MWLVLLLLKKGIRNYGSRYRDKRGKLFGHDAGFVKRRAESGGCETINTCTLRIPGHIICYELLHVQVLSFLTFIISRP